MARNKEKTLKGSASKPSARTMAGQGSQLGDRVRAKARRGGARGRVEGEERETLRRERRYVGSEMRPVVVS